MGVGLRTTLNRFASMTVPIVMGAVADLVGIENSFLVMGAVLLSILIAATAFLILHPKLGRGAEG